MLAKVLESIIKSGQYDREDIQLKLDVFWAKDRLTDDEYDYLCNLIDEYPPIEDEE